MHNHGPKGIGGWLILPTIIFFFGAIWYSLVSVLLGPTLFLSAPVDLFQSDNKLSAFYHLLFAVLLVATAILCIYTLILEFKKKRLFPGLAITTVWTHLALYVFSSGLGYNVYSTSRGIIVAIITVLLSQYFQHSERIKNTFVE